MRRLGDYELLRKIGSGGMAEVWMGRRAAMAGASKAVAIKLLAPNVLDDPAYREMFMEEARLSMLLTNSNVVQVFDVGEIKGECFMVMEWVDGLNLSELSRKMLHEGERLSVGVVAHIVGEVLRGLSYAHGLHHEGSQATIVHRDVSPHNVLVSVSGEVKLADFGVARLAHEETSGLHVKGKLRYMAPEQLRGRSRDPKVDLYAVGAILHELLAGERFRATRDEADLYSMVLTGEHPPLTVEIPAQIEALRSGLLEADPDRRIQSANDALELLHRWPGYRNHSLELAKLIRRWIGVGAPRSGIISTSMAAARRETGPSTASAAATVPADTRPVASSAGPDPDGDDHDMATEVEPATHADSGPSVDRGVTQTRTFVEPETTPSMGSMVPPRAPLPSMLIVVAMTLALSFGIFGLGFPLGWWGAGGSRSDSADSAQDVGSQVAIAPAISAKAEQASGPVTEKTTNVDTGSAETGGTGTTGVETTGVETASAETASAEMGAGAAGGETGGGEPEDGEDGGGETDSGDDAPADPAVETEAKVKPATVVLKTGDFTFVYVKIGGKVQALEPTGTVKLKPGTHKVFLRLDEGDPWKAAGKLVVEAGKRYTVSMKKPASFELR